MQDGKGTVRIERIFDAPVQAIWKALTERDKMKQWYFEVAEFSPEVGFAFDFWAGPEDRLWHHLCRVTEAVPYSKLSYTWKYEGREGESQVSFHLYPEGGKTKLVLTHSGLDTFPKEVEELKEENFAHGWDAIINTQLADYLQHK